MEDEADLLDQTDEQTDGQPDTLAEGDDAPPQGEGPPDGDAPADDADEGPTDGEGSETDEVVVSIGDEQPQPEEAEHRAPEWVRELRQKNREQARRIRELEQAQSRQQPAKPAGQKPTLESCDFDADRFERELTAWHERKQAEEAEERKQREAEEAAARAWQAKLKGYADAKAALKVPDFEDAEAVALEHLSQVQQGVIVNGADNAALLVYALGRNPQRAKELAAIADPVKFAFAVAKLETQLKVTPRKPATLPEKTVAGGSAPGTTLAAQRLDDLRRKAEASGDYSAYFAAKRKLKAA